VHKILHGEDIDYGSIENVIKLFLILDYLSIFTLSNLVDPDDSDVVDERRASDFVEEPKWSVFKERQVSGK